jgi:hypothetical protein
MDELTTEHDKRWRTILLYIVCYVLWFGLSAALFWLIFRLRALLVDGMMWLRLNPWAVRGFDRWGIFVLGMAGVVVMFVMEGYLRDGVEAGQLWRRVGRVVLAMAILAVAILIGDWLIRGPR